MHEKDNDDNDGDNGGIPDLITFADDYGKKKRSFQIQYVNKNTMSSPLSIRGFLYMQGHSAEESLLSGLMCFSIKKYST